MKIVRWLLLAVIIALLILFLSLGLPVQSDKETRVDATAQECPEPTEKGEYFSRGENKNGDITCGFTYYNECPYFSGAEAGTKACEDANPDKKPVPTAQPDSTQTLPIGGK